MADATTPNYGFVQPEVGGSNDSWGAKLNATINAIDGAIKARADAIAALDGEVDAVAATAAAAQSTANAASSTASAASTAASAASTAASAAQSTANTAQGRIDAMPADVRNNTPVPWSRGGLNSNVTDAAGARAALGIGSMATRNVTISTSAPSGGADGDIWLRY